MAKIYNDREIATWLGGRPKKSVAVKAIIRSDQGNILIVKPNYKPGWQIPGGGVDAREEPRVALVRELKEELSLDSAAAELKIVGTVFRPEHDNLILVYEYAKMLSEDTKFRLQAEEIEDYKFVNPDQVAGQLGDYYTDFWREYRL